MKRSIAAAIMLCLALVIVPSFPAVRAVLSAPLVVHDPDASGDACYVLAGGESIWERLNAVADLVHLRRVSRIYLMEDQSRDQYNVKAGRSWTRIQWLRDYLAWRGVATDRISLIPKADGFFGTLAEARTFAGHAVGVKKVVIVSSAPHMRRALLAFRRSLPSDVQVAPYAASGVRTSYELYNPLWIEYLKLLVYWIIA